MVAAVISRTQAIGMNQEIQEHTTCCFAVQDKTWIKGPENDWEFYTVLDDAAVMSCDVESETSTCC